MANHRIKTQALRAFIAVFEEQSFSKAAKRENTTQSGMSTQVKNLETVLDTTLMIRERRRMTLTPAGEIIYRNGQKILRLLMETERAVAEAESAIAGNVRFGMIPSLTRSALVPALERYADRFPDVELSLLEEYSHSLMRRVLDGEIEFAFVPSTDLPAGLTGRFVGQDREMLVTSLKTQTGAVHLARVPLSTLNGRKLIVPSPLNVRRNRIETLLRTHAVAVAETMEMDGMLATLEMIARTDWTAILPGAICHPDKPGTQRRLNLITEPPMTVDYVMVTKSETALSRAASLLAEVLVKEIARVLDDWDDLKHGDAR